MITLYGINNCDSCRKARKWLEQHDIEFRFTDVRADGFEESLLKKWQSEADWKVLLNRRSATWRNIPATERDNLDPALARELIMKYPTVMKRPVLDTGDWVLLGFDAGEYAALGL